MAEELPEPLAPVEAGMLIRSILRGGKTRYASRARVEMRADDLIESDVVSVLRSGIVEPAELRPERPELARTWRYTVHTGRGGVVVVFRSPDILVVVRAWRKKQRAHA